MATIQVPRQEPPTTIDVFKGLNESDSGDTQLELGEASTMKNFRLTTNAKLRKREGYVELFATLGVHDIRGMWYGKVAGTFYLLFACNGNVYKSVAGVNASIGTLTDAKTSFFSFKDKVYIINRSEYYSWDGTTYAAVAGYRPIIATESLPAGGGTENEQTNLLNGKKEQWFSPDGVAVNYQLAETTLTSVDFVKNRVTGVTYTVTTDYTVNLTTGVVTFVIAPIGGTPDSISIGWTKGSGSRSEVTGYQYAMLFGGQNDTRVFFYYNGTNRYIYTGLAGGVPSAEYFPPFNYNEVGSAEFAVTDLIRQYDRQLIFTNGMDTHYSYYDPITVNGNVIASFPTFTLNDAVGNIAPGQAQVIQNNPFSIQNGVYEWQATNVRDERNVSYLSQKVQLSLSEVDLTQAVTVDWEAMREYWLAIGNKVWVFNYRLGAWYRFETADNITCFLIADNEMYIGTPSGKIMKFDTTKKTDNGTAITAIWEMGFYDFLAEWIRKFLNRVWISMMPETRASLAVTWQTDFNASSSPTTIFYNLLDFGDIDFGDFTFLTYYNPQPFRLKIKAKKFVYFKLILTNESLTDAATVLSINLLSRMGGQSK